MIEPDVKLIAIVGPTASGKSAMAMRLAELFNGEIVCADSRTVYRGLDIGTAKPTADDRARVPHHLLDIIEPDQTLSAAEFKRLADDAVNEIASRGHLPFLVGGSGLYIDAVVFEYEFPPMPDQLLRKRLNGMSLDDLRLKFRETFSEDDGPAIDMSNPRRIIRAIESRGSVARKRSNIRPNTLMIGINLPRDVLEARVRLRLIEMVDQGLLEEIKKLGSLYGVEYQALDVMGYSAFKQVVFGSENLNEAMEKAVKEHFSLIKKQQTWFKRNKAIRWVSGEAEAQAIVRDFLNQPLDS